MTSKGKATIFSLHSKRNLDEGNSESNFFLRINQIGPGAKKKDFAIKLNQLTRFSLEIL